LKIGEKGLSLIKKFEGLRLKAYQDSVGIWTIGYGTIKYPDGVCVKEGDTCTEEQAEEYLIHHINEKITVKLNEFLDRNKIVLTQPQIDALYSFSYNLGLGPITVGGKSLNMALLSGNKDSITKAILLYDKAGGKVLEGLKRRRQAESALFLS